jgi:hypothetical protein
MATLHGRDLLQEGFTVEQVIRDYGDLCQAVTNLPVELGTSIPAREFSTFNRCLDDAMAAAVTEYSQQNSQIVLLTVRRHCLWHSTIRARRSGALSMTRSPGFPIGNCSTTD